MEEESKEYRWETGYEKTWEAIKEDSDGLLELSVQEMIQRARRKRMIEKSGAKIKLGMMRHLFIVLDMSDCMKLQDLKPTRMLCATKLVQDFIEEYFYLNPISQIGLIITRSKRAELISELAGNPRQHVENIKRLAQEESECSGEPSLQNSLELTIQTLRNMPGHASREVLIITGSLTTCDPGDISTTISTCKSLNIRCSVIALCAEVRIYRELSRQTGGTYNVILDDVHLKDLLHAQLEPPPSTLGTEPTLIKMGFPCHTGDDSGDSTQGPGLGLCMCHLDTTSGCKLSTTGFLCPQCQAKYCELPVECKCCGLTLVSAPHLARSYHHLFPLPVFTEIPVKECIVDYCFSCTISFQEGSCLKVYQCPECQNTVCSECDLFFHNILHSCAGCMNVFEKLILDNAKVQEKDFNDIELVPRKGSKFKLRSRVDLLEKKSNGI